MKPSHGQSEFDFDRGDRLALLDQLPIRSGTVADGRSSAPVSGATALSVLRAIEAHARSRGVSWAAAATIGREINRNERTVRRAINYLEMLKLLIVERPDGMPIQCRINWGELSLLAKWNPTRNDSGHSDSARSDQSCSHNDSSSGHYPGHSISNPGQFDTNPGHSDRNPGHYVRRSVSKRKRNLPPSSPNSIDGARQCDSAEPRESWKEVKEVLVGILSDWTRALRDARASGVGPRHVLEIVQHYKTLGRRVTPGALFWRLRNAHPSLEPRQGWPVEPAGSVESHRPSPGEIYGDVVRSGRKQGASEDQIRTVLAKRLVAAGYEPDAEVF